MIGIESLIRVVGRYANLILVEEDKLHLTGVEEFQVMIRLKLITEGSCHTAG